MSVPTWHYRNAVWCWYDNHCVSTRIRSLRSCKDFPWFFYDIAKIYVFDFLKWSITTKSIVGEDTACQQAVIISAKLWVNVSPTRLKSSRGRRNARRAALIMRAYSLANHWGLCKYLVLPSPQKKRLAVFEPRKLAKAVSLGKTCVTNTEWLQGCPERFLSHQRAALPKRFKSLEKSKIGYSTGHIRDFHREVTYYSD